MTAALSRFGKFMAVKILKKVWDRRVFGNTIGGRRAAGVFVDFHFQYSILRRSSRRCNKRAWVVASKGDVIPLRDGIYLASNGKD